MYAAYHTNVHTKCVKQERKVREREREMRRGEKVGRGNKIAYITYKKGEMHAFLAAAKIASS